MSRVITPKLLIAWDGTNYVDETVNFVSASGSFKVTAPGYSIVSPKGTVDSMNVVLHNSDEVTPYSGKRYSPLNTGGSLYSLIRDGKAYHRPIKFQISIGGSSFSSLFTGVIKIPQEGVPTPKGEATVSIECRSVEELLLQKKLSTSGASVKNYIDTPVTESEIIEDLLTHSEINFTNYIINDGFFHIRYFWMDDESVMEELWALAAACGGSIYSDRAGKLIYNNMQTWLVGSSDSSPKVKTFTRSDYTDLKLRYGDSDLYNTTVVEASPRRLGENSVLWEPDETISVPANNTRAVTAKLRQPAYFLDDVSFQAVSAGGVSLSANVSVAATIFAQRVELVFTNTHPTQAANIKTLQIKGIPIVGAPTLEETVDSTNAFWTGRTGRTRTFRGNVYVQNRAHAKALADFLSIVSESPKLLYTISNTPGSLGYHLGSKIGIYDSKTMSAEASAFITSINWSYSASGGFMQTIEAIDASTFLKYPAADYFVLGTSTMSACNGTGKRVYY